MQVFGVANLLGVCVVTELSPKRRTDRESKGSRSSSVGNSEDSTSLRLLGEGEKEVEVVGVPPRIGTGPPPLTAAPLAVSLFKEPKFK